MCIRDRSVCRSAGNRRRWALWRRRCGRRRRVASDRAALACVDNDQMQKLRTNLSSEGMPLAGASPEDLAAERDALLVGGSASANPHPGGPRSGEFARSGFLFA
eukprot:8163220-Alexandrium_andersonii.AAC.1